MKLFTSILVISGLTIAMRPDAGRAESSDDWPMWRHDAGRTAATAGELPAALRLQWKREFQKPAPAFPNDSRLCFDKSYEPVAAEGLIFVPSMVTDSVAALDAGTGEEQWRFFADGPVRYAPLFWQKKVYFVSDDGFLYCVDAADGRLQWKYSPLDPERAACKLLGDERLISRWPARGGLVLAGETVYFAVGIWLNEGVEVCAVNANTGKPLWNNRDCTFVKEGLFDHGGRWDGGLVPQGYLSVVDRKLVVPGGRSLPGFFDCATGRMDPYTSGWGGRIALAKGSWYVSGIGDFLFQSGDLYRKASSVSAPGPKPGEFVELETFAKQMKASPATVEKWIKQFKLDVVDREGKRWFKVRNGDEITYLSWWTSSKSQPLRAGEKNALESYIRLQIDPANAKELGVFREPVFSDNTMYYSIPVVNKQRILRNSNDDRLQPRKADYTYSEIVACDLGSQPQWEPKLQGGWGTPNRLVAWNVARFNQLWSLPLPLKVHIKAGRQLYAGSPGMIAAIDIPARGQPAKVSWQASISGTPHRMLAANGRLFIVTLEGELYCFGAEKKSSKTYASVPECPASPEDTWTVRAREILQQTGVREGYGIVLGLGTGRLVEELACQSRLRLIVLEPDAGKIVKARRELYGKGLYGPRVHVLQGDLMSLKMSPYLASVIVAEDFPSAILAVNQEYAKRLFTLLRPYGGKACFASSANIHEAFAHQVHSAGLVCAAITRNGKLSVLSRQGALPDTADWMHESGEAANTFASSDQQVKGPLGVLWFGGELDRTVPWIEGDPPCLPSEPAPSPYAGAGPRPRVAGGRMFVQIGDELYATDIYTGRHLWKQTVKSLNDIVATVESVYAMSGKKCLRLDAATGERLDTFSAPGGAVWGQVRISGDSLVGTTGKWLVCLDRLTGILRWKVPAQRDGLSFALGSDRVFCVDYWNFAHRKKGDPGSEEAEITALNLASGDSLWRVQAVAPALAAGTKWSDFAPPLVPQLAFSERADVLLFTRNTATTEAYQGSTGHLLWSKELPCKDPPDAFTSYHPPIVLADKLVTHGGQVIDLKTGEPCAERLWKNNNINRGCGRALGCPNLVLIRDSSVSYFDLKTGAHTYFRGIRSGCTNTLIPAGGVLNAPNYAHHCNCNYPIYVSLAFVTMPEAAGWNTVPSNIN
ncbi:MAG: PQQ-binding-like beta-propeller repeat protein [Kiritimatiellae bacterium]|nr:PQQ-binding-like beta-propeller repeat protein [Kiritimatiellia bacterium]MDD5522358.1 PQQ-binding-like beta-propeller repeat protein [Kiritimatiellia bacterium]